MSFSLSILMLFAVAGEPADHLARGKAAIEALEYESAAEELTIAAAHNDATLEQRIEANLYAGIAHRVLGRDVDAKLNFIFVLRHVPETELPAGTPPKIRNFYDLIRLELSPKPVASFPPAAPDAEVIDAPVAEKVAASRAPPRPFPIFPSIVLAAGATTIMAGVVAAFVFDSILAAPLTTAGEKEMATYGGFAALAVTGVGLTAGVVGSSWLVWTLLE